MARETGKLKVSAKLGGSIKKGKKTLRLPKTYNLEPSERFNNKECEYEIENGQLKVFVDGEELPKDTAALQKKEESKKRQAEEEERRVKAEAQAKKNAALSRQYGNDSFDVKRAFCPKDTSDLNIHAYEVDNFSLKLNKFARFVENERDYSKSNIEFFKTHRGKVEHQIIVKYGDLDFHAITRRAKNTAIKLLGEKQSHVFSKTTAGRLITGLGGASVYETDITLHHIYGFPFLPASSIKGIVRSWIILNAFDNDEKKALSSDTDDSRAFCHIFGCGKESILKKEHQGRIQFFEGLPVEAPKVIPDVMNPHYGPYYNGNKPPADYHNPVPIFFLTVEKQTQFQFILGSKYPEWLDWKIGGEDITSWLKNALENHGIGAKTAVGYGYMQ
jgi:CRISPR-associated protein Cmr6